MLLSMYDNNSGLIQEDDIDGTRSGRRPGLDDGANVTASPNAKAK